MDSWLENHRGLLVLVLIGVIAVGAVVWLQRLDDRRPLLLSTATPAPLAGGPRVYVSGAVVAPGVYPFADGDRVEQAIQRAGGPSEEADLQSINLSIRLKDEQHVRVPARGQPAPAASSFGVTPIGRAVATSAPSSWDRETLVDLNSATQSELESLPGIGPVTAQRIIEYRARAGGLRDVDDLKANKVINAGQLSKIQDLVTIGDYSAPPGDAVARTATPAPR